MTDLLSSMFGGLGTAAAGSTVSGRLQSRTASPKVRTTVFTASSERYMPGFHAHLAAKINRARHGVYITGDGFETSSGGDDMACQIAAAMRDALSRGVRVVRLQTSAVVSDSWHSQLKALSACRGSSAARQPRPAPQRSSTRATRCSPRRSGTRSSACARRGHLPPPAGCRGCRRVFPRRVLLRLPGHPVPGWPPRRPAPPNTWPGCTPAARRHNRAHQAPPGSAPRSHQLRSGATGCTWAAGHVRRCEPYRADGSDSRLDGSRRMWLDMTKYRVKGFLHDC